MKPKTVRKHSFSNARIQNAERWSAAVGKPGIKLFLQKPLLRVNEIIQIWKKRKAFHQWKQLAPVTRTSSTYSTARTYSPRSNKFLEEKFQSYSDNDEYPSDVDKIYSPDTSQIEEYRFPEDAASDDRYETEDNIFSASNGEVLHLDSLNDHYISRADFNKENVASKAPSQPSLPPQPVQPRSFSTNPPLLKEKSKPRDSLSESILESLKHSQSYLNSTISTSLRDDFFGEDNSHVVSEQPFTLTDIVFEEGMNGGFEFSP